MYSSGAFHGRSVRVRSGEFGGTGAKCSDNFLSLPAFTFSASYATIDESWVLKILSPVFWYIIKSQCYSIHLAMVLVLWLIVCKWPEDSEQCVFSALLH